MGAACIDATAAAALDLASPDGRSHRPCYSIRPWACVYTHPQAERWADANLRRIGYATYLPIVTAQRRDPALRSLTHRVSVPLFPRYLFIRFDAHVASWSPIRACPGVVDLVRSGKAIPQIGDSHVEAVRSALQAAEAASAIQPHGRARRHPGEAVRPVAGPFQGHDGVVVKVGRDKALVSLLVFGALREVLVPLEAIEVRNG